MDNELFKMMDMLCKSTDSSNPFHILARRFSSDGTSLMNHVRNICKDSQIITWEKINGSDPLEPNMVGK